MRPSILRIFACATIALALFAAASSAGRSATADGLRAVLGLELATPPAPRRGASVYVDLSVLGAIAGKRGLDALVASSQRLGQVPLGEMLASPTDAIWLRNTGFARDDIEALATFGEPPDSVTVLRLAPAVPIEQLTSAWRARGYNQSARPGGSFWLRGKPGEMDPSRRDPDDPFGGMFGWSSVLLWIAPLLAETRMADTLAAAALARNSGGLGARADVAALLAALDRSGGSLAQAALLPEPATAVTQQGGIAPYSALLLADVQNGARAETMLLLAFADCTAARAAQGEIEKRWPAQHEAVRIFVPAWTVEEISGCVLRGRVAGEGADGSGAKIFSYRRMLDALYQRGLTAIEMRPGR